MVTTTSSQTIYNTQKRSTDHRLWHCSELSFLGSNKKSIEFLRWCIDNFKDHYVKVFDLSSMQHATENCLYPKLVVELLRLQLNFTFPLEHVTKHIVLREWMSSVAVEKFGVAGKNLWIGWRCSSGRNQSHLSTEITVLCFILFKLYLDPSRWDCCHYEYATEQFASWALDIGRKLLSQLSFCRPSRRWKLQLPRAAVQADDAKTFTVPSQCLRFLHDFCRFSSLQGPTNLNHQI